MSDTNNSISSAIGRASVILIIVGTLSLPAVYPELAVVCSLIGWPIVYIYFHFNPIEVGPHLQGALPMILVLGVMGLFLGKANGKPFMNALAMICVWIPSFFADNWIPSVRHISQTQTDDTDETVNNQNQSSADLPNEHDSSPDKRDEITFKSQGRTCHAYVDMAAKPPEYVTHCR